MPNSLGTLMRTPIQYGREVRTERDKIFTRALVDEIQIKVEFVLEGRIKITGAVDSEVGVPVLDRTDMYAEKLLANEDRCLDRSVMNRDAIDLAMMIHYWGPIPAPAWDKTIAAYGPNVRSFLKKALGMLEENCFFEACLKNMSMDLALKAPILEALRAEVASNPVI